MSQEKAKGSLVLKAVIAILVVVLILTLLYPKSVWKQEEENTKACRINMDRILKAELVYQKYFNTYTDSLPELVSFFENDTTKEKIKDYFKADTALADQMLSFLRKTSKDANMVVENILSDTLLYAIIESINYDSNLARIILDRLEKTDLADTIAAKRSTDSSDVFILKELRKMYSSFELYNPIKDDDSLKLVFSHMIPEVTTGYLLDTLYNSNERWAKSVDSAVDYTVNNFITCPTVKREYKLAVIDTSVMKDVHIKCPLDSAFIDGSRKNFLKYNFGHLRLENHGKIEDHGEKSWSK